MSDLNEYYDNKTLERLREMFSEYKTIHMKDFLPKMIRLQCIKMYELDQISNELLQKILHDETVICRDPQFTNYHWKLLVEYIISEIVHSDNEVFQKLYKSMYEKYMFTSTWRKIAEKVKERDNYICQNCSKKFNVWTMPKFHADHKHYDNVFKELLDDLQTLCPECNKSKNRQFQ